MREFILASASPRRSELLKQVGIKFKIIPSYINEDINPDMGTCEFAQYLSYEKALSVAKQIETPSLVMGADTIVVRDRILGKPSSEQEAFEMLNELQGEWHEVITGVSVIDSAGLKYIKDFEKTRVKMRSLDEHTIKQYIKTGECMDKAGAYGIQGLGALLVEKIEGCYFNVVGLPLTKLGRMLEDFGFSILNGWVPEE